MHYPIYLVSLLMCLPGWLAAQSPSPVDNLYQQLDALPEAEHAQVYNSLGFRYYRQSDFPNAELVFQKGAELAKVHGQWGYYSQAQNGLGAIDFQRDETAEGIQHYQQAIAGQKKAESWEDLAAIYLNLGLVYKRMGAYDSAVVQYYRSITLLEVETPKSPRLITAYQYLANALRESRSMAEAETQYNRALALAVAQADTSQWAQILNNQGAWYLESGLADSARGAFRESLMLKRLSGAATRLVANSHYNLGDAHLALSQSDSALFHYQKAYWLRQQGTSAGAIAYAMIGMGEAYTQLDQFDSAQQYLQRAAQEINRLQQPNLSEVLWKAWVAYYRRNGNYAAALQATDSLRKYEAQILNEEKQQTITQYEVRFALHDLEQDLQVQEGRLIVQRRRVTWLVGLILLASITLVLLYRLYLQRKRNEHQLQTLLQDLHHRLKNDLSAVTGILAHRKRFVQEEVAKVALDRCRDQIVTIQLLHKSLYQRTDRSITQVSLEVYLGQVVENVTRRLQGVDADLRLVRELDSVTVSANDAQKIGLICNEVLTNAIKYGATDTNRWDLAISLLKDEGCRRTLTITDGGPGIGHKNPHEEGEGLTLITQLCRQLKATYRFQQENGTSFTMEW